MVVTWFLIALTVIDLDHQLLPDSLTLPLLWVGLLAQPAGAGYAAAQPAGRACARRSSAPSPAT